MKMKQFLVQILIMSLIFIQSGISQTSTPGTGKAIDFEKYNSSPFGENVFVFDPGMDMKEIQIIIDTIFRRQSGRRGEFSKNRYALLL